MQKTGKGYKLMGKIFHWSFNGGLSLNFSAFFQVFFAANSLCLFWGRGVEDQHTGYQKGCYKNEANPVFSLHGCGFGM